MGVEVWGVDGVGHAEYVGHVGVLSTLTQNRQRQIFAPTHTIHLPVVFKKMSPQHEWANSTITILEKTRRA
jgi:hypothetical protein